MRTAILVLCACLIALPAVAQNLVNGKEIFETCAACHGKHAQGGKNGEYPRIAGQRVAYIEEQLQAFRSRKRLNIPMLPYTQPRELPDEDISDVAAYISSITLTTTSPTFTSSEDAIQRREALDRVFRVERIEGDVTQGLGIYKTDCANCHAKDGKGRSNFPLLVGQYPNYLKRQMDIFRRGGRPHDEDVAAKGVLMALTDLDIQNILAYLTWLQDQPEQ